MSSPQVLIVGGLTAAVVLHQNGVTVHLIETALDYQIGVCDNGIQVTGMDIPDSLVFHPLTEALLQPMILEVFKVLGLVTDIFNNSINPPQMRAYDGKTLIRTWHFGIKEHVIPSIPHTCTISFMDWDGTHEFTQDAHKVTANLLKQHKNGSSQNETLEVDWVIGTDRVRGYLSPVFVP
ncbi:hypothetical protein BS47DRAFT_1370015 [Hydnum rufescens UP504]|uniref:Uncharacterized protein n=1 Tax=Hydnum rufescens UP504 TaxID=1448309 RepID=A0A9P6AAS5_9AGAM|nr:hypothetical protein BS47DRAFT_1370015 [Hydnum rufescens UP504]